MLRPLYTLAIHLLTAGIRVAALFHPKAKQWVAGRRHWRSKLAPSTVSSQRSTVNGQQPTVVWLHAASLGEFEQGRPIIESLRERHPDWRIVLTFFSPSGYEVRKNYPHADLVCYLPADTPRNAADFLEKIRPDVAIFVKYEFWANYLFELKKRGTPTLLVSALFRETQPFFQWYGGFWREILGCFTHFFLQNQPSAKLLQSIGFQNLTVAGDTRVDRVLSLAAWAAENAVVAAFCQPHPRPLPQREGRHDIHRDASEHASPPLSLGEGSGVGLTSGQVSMTTLVVGSSWEADENLIARALQRFAASAGATSSRPGTADPIRLIIAPHDPSEKNVERICEQFAGAMRYSVVSRQSTVNSQQSTVNGHSTLVIDNVGLLNTLYRYGTVAYIGGGFGKGIHNTLEPAAWGLPVIFGPKYEKFEEARQFVARGGAFVVHTPEDLAEVLSRLSDPGFHAKAAAAVRGYLEESRGATEQVLAFLENRMPAVLFPPN